MPLASKCVCGKTSAYNMHFISVYIDLRINKNSLWALNGSSILNPSPLRLSKNPEKEVQRIQDPEGEE